MRLAFVTGTALPPRWLSTCAWVAMAAALASCRAWQADRVEVSLAVSPGASAKALHRVSLIVGGERVSWPVVDVHDGVSATFAPEAGADRQVTLLFNHGSAQGPRLSWEGPAAPSSAAGYRLSIAVDGAGVVHARHCQLPCQLP
ncbi:MAG: hypothetical protein EOP40_04620 [Rubrivivax sp.]|nr:MAG: hypothetical protein EOP40_04620 [Rubrivivax sp.]